ncbi:hypothetical protein BB560_000997 [Smittium megazygosporum]|uniref:Geranylgeranyl transferase type-2 subunit alpha n=1 Tax=Smittium megazygosporum TaxID=133381 RepID=A0A2T9ZIT3_9FUNG|nr:hypothetical protein BB560_000997 [Smittium megazygosporum]
MEKDTISSKKNNIYENLKFHSTAVFTCKMQHGRQKKTQTEAQRIEREAEQKRRIEEYKVAQETVFNGKEAGKYDSEILQHTTELLELNPEINTAWNYRRQILQHLFISLQADEKQTELETELAFINSLIRKNIKSYWMWNHRKWILESMPTPNWEGELALINKLFDVDATNFHGWDYRRYVIDNLGTISDMDSLKLKEFDYTYKRIKQNFSNHSAWHYRSKLFPSVIQIIGPDLAKKLLKKEVEIIKRAIYSDPDDQNAWLYLEWLSDFGDEKHKIRTEGFTIAKELIELSPESKYAMISVIKYITDPANTANITTEDINLCLVYILKLKALDPFRAKMYDSLESKIKPTC